MVNQLQREFTTKQIEDSLGLKANTLHYYIHSGAITPGIETGTGTRRLLSATNYVEAVIIRQLMKFGVPKRTIINMFRSIDNANERDSLNPSRQLKKESDVSQLEEVEYLVFFLSHDDFNPGGISHKFVLGGTGELEEYLFRKTECIVINLKNSVAIFMAHLLMGKNLK